MESGQGWSRRIVDAFAAYVKMAESNVEHVVQSLCGVCSQPSSAVSPQTPLVESNTFQFRHPSMKCFPLECHRPEICHVVFRQHFLGDDLPQVTQVRMSHFLQSLPANCSNSRTSVHLQLHGVEPHSQFSSHASVSMDLLRRHARSVQLCFSPAPRNDSLVFAPTSKQVSTVTKVSSYFAVALHSESGWEVSAPKHHTPLCHLTPA